MTFSAARFKEHEEFIIKFVLLVQPFLESGSQVTLTRPPGT